MARESVVRSLEPGVGGRESGLRTPEIMRLPIHTHIRTDYDKTHKKLLVSNFLLRPGRLS